MFGDWNSYVEVKRKEALELEESLIYASLLIFNNFGEYVPWILQGLVG